MDQPLNSWTCAGQEPDRRQVVTFSQCAAIKAEPIAVAPPQIAATPRSK